MFPEKKQNHSDGGLALGRHMTLEYYDCETVILADCAALEKIFLTAAERSGATVIESKFHRFEPQGVSGVVIICESHFAVHAWPEHDYAAVDLFTCGDSIDFDCAARVIGEGLRSRQWIVSSLMHRGIVGDNGVERLVPVIENRDARFSLSWKKRYENTGARGLSAAIDVYECRANILTGKKALAEFVRDWTELLGHPCAGELNIRTGDGNCRDFSQSIAGGEISGRLNPEAATAFLNIFVTGFFEPRTAAEFAVRKLEGSYYRMQPHVRQ